MAQPDHSLAYTLPFQLTKKIRRDPYDALSPESPANSQKGKIILITGGGSGIGAAAASVWIRAGAEGVVICGRRQEVLEKTAAGLRASTKGTKILTVKADVVSSRHMENVYKEIQNTFGRPADVVLASAGAVGEKFKTGEDNVENWWKTYEINIKGLYTTVHHFIKSQPNPDKPQGTIIAVNSGLAGVVEPGLSAYSISKSSGQRLVEYIDAEYPTLRAFSLLPGVIMTDLLHPDYIPFAKDHLDLPGSLALWLASSRSDFVKGQLVSVNWDVEEMGGHGEEILEQKLLQTTWVPVLPASGGKGFD